jgi:hypothetical protein
MRARSCHPPAKRKISRGSVSQLPLASQPARLVHPFSGLAECRARERDVGTLLRRAQMPEMRSTEALWDDRWSTGQGAGATPHAEETLARWSAWQGWRWVQLHPQTASPHVRISASHRDRVLCASRKVGREMVPRADRLCAAGSNKLRTLEAVRLSAANSALRGWRGSPAPSGSARIADAGARWLRRYNNHAALRWCCRSALRFPAHHRAFYTGAFREPLAIGTVSHAASWLRSGTLGSWASSPVALLCSANF